MESREIVAIYAGVARYCNACGSLRNENDFTSRVDPEDRAVGPGGPVIVPCDYCREEKKARGARRGLPGKDRPQ